MPPTRCGRKKLNLKIELLQFGQVIKAHEAKNSLVLLDMANNEKLS